MTREIDDDSFRCVTLADMSFDRDNAKTVAVDAPHRQGAGRAEVRRRLHVRDVQAARRPVRGSARQTLLGPDGVCQRSYKHAQAAEPDKTLVFIAFPDTDLSTLHHYAMFMRGDTPLTSRLVKPVLMDAGRG